MRNERGRVIGGSTMCDVKKFSWTLVVGIGVLFAAGRAVAAGDESGAAGTAECHDAGVTLTFKSASTMLNGRARSSLNGVVKWLKEDPRRTVRVDAYTDKS